MRDQSKTAQMDMDTWLMQCRTQYGIESERPWEDIEPVYRVGYDVAQTHGRERGWRDIEPEYRRAWSERYPDKPWDRFLDAAQDAWDRLTAEPGPSPKAGSPLAHDESSGR